MLANYVIQNGQVITVDAGNTVAEAVAVYDEKILFVGSNEDVQSYIGPETRVIDAGGDSVLPGFTDAHLHLGFIGINLRWVDCSVKAAPTIKDIQDKIRDAAKANPKGGLIRAFNYDHLKLAEKRHPTKTELDEVAPDHKVILTHASYHMSVLNSAALEEVGITDDTPNPIGGEYTKENGVLTGLLKENAHMYMLDLYPFTEQEYEESLLLADEYLVRLGITSIHDAGDGTTMLKVLTDLKNQKKINVRVYAMLYSVYGNAKFVERYYGLGFHTGFGSDRFKMGPMKFMLDGSTTGETCALREPFENNPDNRGILTMDQDTINDYVLRAHRDGFQITCHAIGDRAIDMILTAYENAFRVFPRTDCRHRIEHASLLDEDLLLRIKNLNLIPVPQPSFIYHMGDAYKYLTGKRSEMAFANASYIKEGIPAPFSSDCPVVNPNPYTGLYAACCRKSLSGQIIGESQKISVQDAIRMYTFNGAYASFEEDIKGSLEPGKLADLTIATAPLLDISPDDLKKVKTRFTMIGGKPVYEDETISDLNKIAQG